MWGVGWRAAPAQLPACCSPPAPKLQVFYNGQRLKVKSFQEYVDMYLGPKDEGPTRVYERISDRWEVCIAPTEGQFNQVGGWVRVDWREPEGEGEEQRLTDGSCVGEVGEER